MCSRRIYEENLEGNLWVLWICEWENYRRQSLGSMDMWVGEFRMIEGNICICDYDNLEGQSLNMWTTEIVGN